jgi:hypothetical protein
VVRGRAVCSWQLHRDALCCRRERSAAGAAVEPGGGVPGLGGACRGGYEYGQHGADGTPLRVVGTSGQQVPPGLDSCDAIFDPGAHCNGASEAAARRHMEAIKAKRDDRPLSVLSGASSIVLQPYTVKAFKAAHFLRVPVHFFGAVPSLCCFSEEVPWALGAPWAQRVRFSLHLRDKVDAMGLTVDKKRHEAEQLVNQAGMVMVPLEQGPPEVESEAAPDQATAMNYLRRVPG